MSTGPGSPLVAMRLIISSESSDIAMTDVQRYLKANTILINFSTSQLFIGGQQIPTNQRYGFNTLLSLAGLVCLNPKEITTSHSKFLGNPTRYR